MTLGAEHERAGRGSKSGIRSVLLRMVEQGLVLVVSSDPDLDDRAHDLSEQIRSWTGNRAHVIGRTPKEIARLRRAKEPILAEWSRDLVVLAGEHSSLDMAA